MIKQPQPEPLSRELILRLQATAGNRAVQRLIKRRRVLVKKTEMVELTMSVEAFNVADPPEPSWWRRRFWWTGGAGLLGLLIGAALWFAFHRPVLAFASPVISAGAALCVIVWVRSGWISWDEL